jgi:hypothetical protein
MIYNCEKQLTKKAPKNDLVVFRVVLYYCNLRYNNYFIAYFFNYFQHEIT